MSPRLRLRPFSALGIAWLGGAALLLAAGPLPVSPGAADRSVELATACPTFSWSAVEGALAYELALLDVSDAESPLVVLSHRVEGAALAWSPARAECLPPGREYAWLVRADLAASGLGEWSAPRRFRVPGVPTAEEVDAALGVLERWRATQGHLPGTVDDAAESGAAHGAASAPGDRATGEAEAPLATGVAAIRGEIPDTTGAAYGLFGITHSAAGAGVVARNEAAGPDLVLDGAAQGEPDTVLTQSGLDRPSAAAATFNFQNSGAGALALQVDGVAVDTAATPIDWARLASVPAGFADGYDNDTIVSAGNQLVFEAGNHLSVVEGSGSGLDADTLDGLHAEDLQALPVGLCPVGQTLRGINPDGSLVCYETPIPPRVSVVDDPANSVGSHSSIAIGADGFPVISHYEGTAGSLKVAKCNDAACAGDDETVSTVDDPGNIVGSYTSIAISADGFPVISYRDDTAGALKVAKCNDPACAGGNETITTVDDSINDVGYYTSLAIGADSFPVISYCDLIQNSLKVAKCSNATCTLTTITIVDYPVNAVGRYTSIAIGADGFPVISYHDFTADALKVAKCNDPACAGGNETITTVDDPGNLVGEYTSIAIGADGFPVISYRDDTAGAIKVAKCNDPACAGGNETITTVDDSINEVGYFTSIAIGADGFPVISYLDGTAGVLKVAKCNDAACAGGNEIITAVDDPLNRVGWYNSIAIGADGFPVISYQDITAGALRVAKCMNPSCRY